MKIAKAIMGLTTLTLLASCGTTRINSKISKDEYDVLRGESYARLPEAELNKLAASSNLLVKGAAMCALKQFNEGEKILLQEVKNQRDNALFWNALAVCSLNSGSYQKSEFYLSLAMGLKKTSPKDFAVLKTNQGMLYLKLRHFTAAREAFEDALKRDPESNAPRFNLAFLNLKFGLLDAAYEHLSLLMAASPKDQDLIGAMATYYTMKGESDKAISYFNKLPQEILAREDISNSYALALYQSGQFEKAYLTLEHAQSTVLGSLRQTKAELKAMISAKLTQIKLAQKEAQQRQDQGRAISSGPAPETTKSN